MKNKEHWVPSKFVFRHGKLKASRNTADVGIGSRLMADIIASLFDTYIPQYTRGKLIDLGCGKVPLYQVYKPYITDNICVDWKNTRHRNEYLDAECDLTKALPFPDDEFDTIILSDVLEHIPQPDLLWHEMSRIIKKDGIAFINVPYYYWLHEIPFDYYRYTEFALRRFADLNDFAIVLLKPIGGSPEIMADILAKHLQPLPLIGKILSGGIQTMTMAFINTRLGKKISGKTGTTFPLGYFLIARKRS